MRYPENLKKGDTIGICAPSGGIVEEEKIAKLEVAIEQLKQMGYKVIETASVRKEERGRSADKKQRAKEFMQLWENEQVKLILYAAGGDFLIEILDELDMEKLKTTKPKWTQGFSDITTLSFLLNTILEFPSMYCENVKEYAMKPLYPNLTNALDIMSGKQVIQTSFEKYEEERKNSANPDASYHLTKEVEWKNVVGKEPIQMQGRALGGCLDCIRNFFGTKYDKIKEYTEKYKEDGILWFLECYEMGTADLYRVLWQMKHAEYFNHCKGILFGRPLFIRNDYDITFHETVKEILKDLNVPIICDVDIGHVPPQMAMVNGAILKVTLENKKGKVETIFK